jgi:hypothetical protein
MGVLRVPREAKVTRVLESGNCAKVRSALDWRRPGPDNTSHSRPARSDGFHTNREGTCRNLSSRAACATGRCRISRHPAVALRQGTRCGRIPAPRFMFGVALWDRHDLDSLFDGKPAAGPIQADNDNASDCWGRECASIGNRNTQTNIWTGTETCVGPACRRLPFRHRLQSRVLDSVPRRYGR